MKLFFEQPNRIVGNNGSIVFGQDFDIEFPSDLHALRSLKSERVTFGNRSVPVYVYICRIFCHYISKTKKKTTNFIQNKIGYLQIRLSRFVGNQKTGHGRWRTASDDGSSYLNYSSNRFFFFNYFSIILIVYKKKINRNHEYPG